MYSLSFSDFHELKIIFEIIRSTYSKDGGGLLYNQGGLVEEMCFIKSEKHGDL